MFMKGHVTTLDDMRSAHHRPVKALCCHVKNFQFIIIKILYINVKRRHLYRVKYVFRLEKQISTVVSLICLSHKKKKYGALLSKGL